MALKPDRKYHLGTDISYFMNETAERGGVVVFSTGGSGVAMDDPNAVVAVPTAVSGTIVAGVLLNDVVDLDLTRQHLNQHQDEVQKGGKVTLLRQGEITTNMIATGVTPTIGQPAYYDSSGDFTNVATSDNGRPQTGNLSAVVGTFKSVKNADGYAKIDVNIQ